MPGGEGMVGCEGDRTVSLYQGPISFLHAAPLTCHFLERMDGNKDTEQRILITQSKGLCSRNTSATTSRPCNMWPCRHSLISHQHSEVDCASMVGHTDQDWIADETWGQGYQLCSASQYPRSLTPFRTLLLARNENESVNRKNMGNLYRSQDQPFCFIGSLSTPTNLLHFQGWKSGPTCCQFRPCAPLPPPGTPALEDRGLHSYTSTPNFPLGIRPS